MEVFRIMTLSAMISIMALCASIALAHEHTHIGINQDTIAGTADDNQLWIFAEGDHPQWDTIELLPTGDFIDGLQVYKAELDCWHSAHPDHGGWQLGGADPAVTPGWQLGLRLVSSSDATHFWLEYESDFFLKNIGDQALFEGPGALLWMTDNYNENGTLGAWGLHVHMDFSVLAAGPGQTFTASFVAYDAGTTGYLDSSPYTMTFVTVPEPATLLLLAAGAMLGCKRRNCR